MSSFPTFAHWLQFWWLFPQTKKQKRPKPFWRRKRLWDYKRKPSSSFSSFFCRQLFKSANRNGTENSNWENISLFVAFFLVRLFVRSLVSFLGFFRTRSLLDVLTQSSFFHSKHFFPFYDQSNIVISCVKVKNLKNYKRQKGFLPKL